MLASLDFNELISFVKGDTHPPLYFIMMWFWTGLFGDSIVLLRLFSVLSHVASSIVFFAILSLTVKSGAIRLISFALFVFSPVLFWYSIEVRMYSLLVFFVTLSLYFLFKKFKSSDNQLVYSIALSVFLALSFYTHYSAILFIIGLFLFYAFKVFLNYKKHLKFFVISTLVTLALTGPWYSTLLKQRELKYEFYNEHLIALTDSNSLGFVKGKQFENVYSETSSFKEIIINLASISGVFPAKNIFILILSLLPFLVLFVLFFKKILKLDGYTIFSVVVIVIHLGGMYLVDLDSRRFMVLLTPVIILLIAKLLSNYYSTNSRFALVVSMGLLFSSTANVYGIVSKSYGRPVFDLVSDLRNSSDPIN